MSKYLNWKMFKRFTFIVFFDLFLKTRWIISLTLWDSLFFLFAAAHCSILDSLPYKLTLFTFSLINCKKDFCLICFCTDMVLEDTFILATLLHKIVNSQTLLFTIWCTGMPLIYGSRTWYIIDSLQHILFGSQSWRFTISLFTKLLS